MVEAMQHTWRCRTCIICHWSVVTRTRLMGSHTVPVLLPCSVPLTRYIGLQADGGSDAGDFVLQNVYCLLLVCCHMYEAYGFSYCVCDA